jgi:hypothetical protein
MTNANANTDCPNPLFHPPRPERPRGRFSAAIPTLSVDLQFPQRQSSQEPGSFVGCYGFLAIRTDGDHHAAWRQIQLYG